MIDVITVFAPRPPEEKWTKYLPLLFAQQESALRFGHEQLVVTDAYLGPRLKQRSVKMPEALMPAMIAGLIAELAHREENGPVNDMLFVDADCLIGRNLDEAFVGEFDLRLTRRDNIVSPVNNGAMYIHYSGIARAKFFFEQALAICGTHWGADQEAISQAARPVPNSLELAWRYGCLIEFADMKPYNVVPKFGWHRHRSNPYVIHFKGTETKVWMQDYMERFLVV